MNKQVLVVVANSGIAKVYHSESGKSLVEIESFEHLESHLHNQELTDDKAVRGDSMWGGTHSIQERLTPKTKEAIVFAKQIADYLAEKCSKETLHSIYLIASPAFLGLLRQSLGAAPLKLIKAEIHKDLTHLSPHEIREYLPPVL